MEGEEGSSGLHHSPQEGGSNSVTVKKPRSKQATRIRSSFFDLDCGYKALTFCLDCPTMLDYNLELETNKKVLSSLCCFRLGNSPMFLLVRVFF